MAQQGAKSRKKRNKDVKVSQSKFPRHSKLEKKISRLEDKILLDKRWNAWMVKCE